MKVLDTGQMPTPWLQQLRATVTITHTAIMGRRRKHIRLDVHTSTESSPLTYRSEHIDFTRDKRGRLLTKSTFFDPAPRGSLSPPLRLSLFPLDASPVDPVQEVPQGSRRIRVSVL